MPYGPQVNWLDWCEVVVSIPHMGCMPYGRGQRGAGQPTCNVSIPHMGCMPYGHGVDFMTDEEGFEFQSLIWVACPTGTERWKWIAQFSSVSIPHMGCMPYGPHEASDIYQILTVSIPHMGCMPYGRVRRKPRRVDHSRFNPSYGLHALRAPAWPIACRSALRVSIPHMGCMPYGL